MRITSKIQIHFVIQNYWIIFNFKIFLKNMGLSSSKACPAISEMKYLNATFAELLCNTLQRKMNVEIV